MSLTIQQRAQVLDLHQREGLSLRMIARMTGISTFAVRGVLHQPLGQDASAVGHAERPLHDVRAHFREEGAS